MGVDGGQVIMVLFQTGSPFEDFLLSGQGAAHYDAAREFPSGSIQLVWVTGTVNKSSNSTLSLLHEEGVNLTEPSSGRHTLSRVRRSFK